MCSVAVHLSMLPTKDQHRLNRLENCRVGTILYLHSIYPYSSLKPFISLHLLNVLYFFIWWQMDVAINKYFFLLIFRKLGFIQQCSHNFIFTGQALESLATFYRYTPSHPVFADPHKIRFAKRDSTLDIKFKCV